MPFQKSIPAREPVTAPACIHIRNKAMCVTGERSALDRDDGSSGPCWCTITQHILGPDRQSVERASCVPGRDCYRDC
jgi:hypothetical protein